MGQAYFMTNCPLVLVFVDDRLQEMIPIQLLDDPDDPPPYLLAALLLHVHQLPLLLCLNLPEGPHPSVMNLQLEKVKYKKYMYHLCRLIIVTSVSRPYFKFLSNVKY